MNPKKIVGKENSDQGNYHRNYVFRNYLKTKHQNYDAIGHTMHIANIITIHL